MIECDVGVTADLQLVCIHDAWLSSNTNVDQVDKFSGRKKLLTIEGKPKNDWWVSDFTLAEIDELRLVQERIERDPSFDGMFGVPTLQEYIDIAKNANRTIGIHVEVKTPEFYEEQLMISTEELLTLINEPLNANGYTAKDDACFIQSFYLGHLEIMANMTDLPKVFLMRSSNMEGVDYNNAEFDWDTWDKFRVLQILLHKTRKLKLSIVKL